MEFSSAPVTVHPSGPIHPPVLIPTQSPSSEPGPELYGSGFVQQDDPATSHSLDSFPGGQEGKARREAASMLHWAQFDSCQDSLNSINVKPHKSSHMQTHSAHKDRYLIFPFNNTADQAFLFHIVIWYIIYVALHNTFFHLFIDFVP